MNASKPYCPAGIGAQGFTPGIRSRGEHLTLNQPAGSGNAKSRRVQKKLSAFAAAEFKVDQQRGFNLDPAWNGVNDSSADKALQYFKTKEAEQKITKRYDNAVVEHGIRVQRHEGEINRLKDKLVLIKEYPDMYGKDVETEVVRELMYAG